MYDNWITDQVYFNIVQSDVASESFDTWINSQNPWWQTNLPVETAIGADAAIENSVTATPFTADANIVYLVTGNFTADAYIVITTVDSIAADAIIKKEGTGGITADADIICVEQVVWVSPADTVSMGKNPVLVFTIPSGANNMHFILELDTVNTFSSSNYRIYHTYEDQTDWEYWDGDSWEPFPAGGVSSIYSGNNCRLTITSDLSETTWYRQVRGGIL